jgi:hypothetical protein
MPFGMGGVALGPVNTPALVAGHGAALTTRNRPCEFASRTNLLRHVAELTPQRGQARDPFGAMRSWPRGVGVPRSSPGS